MVENSLKQIRLFSEYVGDMSHLAKEFYAPVMKLASQYRCYVRAFSYEELFKALSPVKYLSPKSSVCSIIRPTLSGDQIKALNAAKSEADLVTAISDFLVAGIVGTMGSRSTTGDYSDGDLTENEILIKVCLDVDDQGRILPYQECQSMGFVTDSLGSGVSFLENREFQVDYVNEAKSISVCWTWGDPQETIEKKIREFGDCWAERVPGTKIVDVPRHVVLKILEQLDKPVEEKRFELWEHQRTAIQKWAENSFRGIFKMCTGAGKTIAALAGIKQLERVLFESNGELSVVVVACPTRVLVEQWKKEIKDFGFEQAPLLAYESIANYAEKLGVFLSGRRHKGLRIVITTYATFFTPTFAHHIRRGESDGTIACFIADELHNCSSAHLRKALESYAGYFRFRLGLSATPEIEGNAAATQNLFQFFGSILAEYGLSHAIADRILCPYKYYPKPVFLDLITSERYFRLLCSIDKQTGPIDVNLYQERGDLLRQSGVYLPAFCDILDELVRGEHEIAHTLVYCPPGRGGSDHDERQLETVKGLLEDREIVCSSITAATSSKERPEILEGFGNGTYKVLLAIGCLDEGFDLPSTRRAVMLYSVDRERQFIQRRGRILRRAEGKEYAIINDVVILPHNARLARSEAERLLLKEMRRYRIFSDLAINAEEATSIIDKAIYYATRNDANAP